MLKTNMKSFVYSFSVSLLTIIGVGRVFLYGKTPDDKTLAVKNKNVSLFLEEVHVSPSPSKKISLAVYPSFKSAHQEVFGGDPGLEIVLADNIGDIVLPVEFSRGGGYRDKVVEPQKNVALSEVVYSPDVQSYLSGGEEMRIASASVYGGELAVFDDPKKMDSSNVVEASDDMAVNVLEEIVEVGDELIPVQLAKAGMNKSVEFASSQELNHVALNSNVATIQSISDKVNKDEEGIASEGVWLPLSADPWVVAKGGGAKNQMAVRKYTQKIEGEFSEVLKTDGRADGVQIASETVKNLVIPIPEEILKNDDLTPKLAYPSSSDDASKEKIIDAKIKMQTAANDHNLLSPIEEDVVLDASVSEKGEEKKKSSASVVGGVKKEDSDKKAGILGAINSMFSSAKKTISNAKDEAIAKAHAKKISRKNLMRSRPVSIMPTEIRLSFQPGKAEISGQTLRWLQAFAAKAAETPNAVLEIRVDGSGAPDLQQRRINLLYSILTHKGVEYSKINAVFTSRDPNSFVLRSVVGGDDLKGEKGKIGVKHRSDYIQW